MKSYACPFCGLEGFSDIEEESLADHLYDEHGAREMAEFVAERVMEDWS